MSQLAELQAETGRSRRSPEFAARCWQRWPQEADWPGVLDLYEAAAFLRVDYKSIWRACQPSRTDGLARLAHQRIGNTYRIHRTDLARLGRVEARAA